MTPNPPHLYTREEWASMTRTERRLVREHRRRAVEWAQREHEATYPGVLLLRRETLTEPAQP